jgi:rod shape-determining protein MreC
VQNGDLVLTSGDGGLFPRGLPVGVAVKGLDGRWRVVLASDKAPVDYVRILLFKDFAQVADKATLDRLDVPPPMPNGTEPTAAEMLAASRPPAAPAAPKADATAAKPATAPPKPATAPATAKADAAKPPPAKPDQAAKAGAKSAAAGSAAPKVAAAKLPAAKPGPAKPVPAAKPRLQEPPI